MRKWPAASESGKGKLDQTRLQYHRASSCLGWHNAVSFRSRLKPFLPLSSLDKRTNKRCSVLNAASRQVTLRPTNGDRKVPPGCGDTAAMPNTMSYYYFSLRSCARQSNRRMGCPDLAVNPISRRRPSDPNGSSINPSKTNRQERQPQHRDHRVRLVRPTPGTVPISAVESHVSGTRKLVLSPAGLGPKIF